ncbi:SprT-like domain-containing protein [Clostridium sp.]|uniref:SprT-like domain-containing protein n=1 Tax=Clostridium sp. TaxID=1506 RepID=UPI0025BF678F|nr:SprT-like domain-containing protein [Clostridium sp.]
MRKINKEEAEKRIREFMNQEIDKFNKKYNENIKHVDFPILFNRRHNNRGYYKFIRREYTPMEFGFSLYVLENNEEDKIENTILHELAHYIATEIYQDNCQHDVRWEGICEKLEMKDKSARYKRTTEEVLRDYRYWVVCSCNPNKPVALYHKMRKDTLAKFERNAYRCNKCGNNDLVVIDTKMNKVLVGELEKEEV